ncbi:hypothetical protein [Streptomyces sp. NPDC005859]|uniref:Tc toxin subunit A-related protein n=1 Tax=Streptomyces sp. NPDC005859 TaxID=3157170 RepID=UPI0033E2A68B
MNNSIKQFGFHALGDSAITGPLYPLGDKTPFTYDFRNFFHPYVGDLIQVLNQGSLKDMFEPAVQARLEGDFPLDAPAYTLHESGLVTVTRHRKEIDVDEGGPYANYNWELFFHIPLTIAVHLSKAQRFAEAQRWFQYIFDPTSAESRPGNSLALSTPDDPREGDPLTFRWTTDAPDPLNWVGIYSGPILPARGIGSLVWQYTPGTSGDVVLDRKPPLTGGPYTAYMCAKNLYGVLATSAPFSFRPHPAADASAGTPVTGGAAVTSTPGGPADPQVGVDSPERYWKFLRFRRKDGLYDIAQLLTLLSTSDTSAHPLTDEQRKRKTQILLGYQAIKDNPFRPHAVARTRPLAYQYQVVMKYLDNLIAWGDSLFLQDTVESINEATQRYVLAANLLGPRPQKVSATGRAKAQTFAQLKALKDGGLDPTGNALVDLEAQFPFNLAAPNSTGGDGAWTSTLFGIGRSLYFSVPGNDRLLTYWDTVADRLYKIRHCTNMQGTVRPLALFEPPLDPGMLVKATAAGIDVGSIVAGTNQPVGPLRAMPLIHKALELAGEVRSLGGSLLAALEKGDAEHLALLRQSHETKIHQLAKDVRFLQWKNAEQSTEALLRARASTWERYRYYLRMQGLTPDAVTAPETSALLRAPLTEANFDTVFSTLVSAYDTTIVPQTYPRLNLAGESSPSSQSGATGAGALHLTPTEDAELNAHLPAARDLRSEASVLDRVASTLTSIPDFNLDLQFWGIGMHAELFGGKKMSDAVKIAAEILRTSATYHTDQAGMLSRTASHERRADDWILQANLAARELAHCGRQIITSLLTEQIAQHEYLNVQTQIANSQEVDNLLHAKFTNEELHSWMQGEISRLYYQWYRFAFDTARRAERTMKLELRRPELDATDFVQFNYWDGGRKGLLCGEALHLDVKRMEMAYHDNNRRELELTRHVSLRQLDPLALLQLRTAGTATFTIPESLYDRDFPGHYMRRIKSVALSVPSVVGPYTPVPCTLSLQRSSIRVKPLLDGVAYHRRGDGEDERFVDVFGPVESIVTSSGTNDSGLFETAPHDDRFLPFEGAGAESTWKVDLPGELRGFDYSTISDVVLHVRYTARLGGKQLGDKAVKELKATLSQVQTSGLALLLSLRHDFPTAWSAFAAGTTGDLKITLNKSFFPYVVQDTKLKIADKLELYAVGTTELTPRTVDISSVPSGTFDSPPNEMQLSLSPDDTVLKPKAGDVLLVMRYSLEGPNPQ